MVTRTLCITSSVISFCAYTKRGLPEIRSGLVLHWELERSNATVLFMFRSVINRFIEPSSRKIGLNTSINRLGVVLVKPCVQFLDLSWAESLYRLFNFLNGYGACLALLL